MYRLIILLTFIFITHSYAGAINKFTISINGNKGQCEFDYGEVNFCSNYYLNLYQKSLNLKPNFNKNYILLDVGQDGTIVVVDPIHKEAFPLYGQYSDGEDENGKLVSNRILKFSKNDNKICIKGRKYAYRDISNNETYCYELVNNKFEDFDPNKKVKIIKNDLIQKKIGTIPSVSLPFNYKSKFEKKNTLFGREVTENLVEKIEDLGGSINPSRLIIKLPNKDGVIVYLATYVDEGEQKTFILNTYFNGKAYHVYFDAGAEFFIDRNYKIKVQNSYGKKTKFIYYNILDDGEIISSSNPF